MATVQRDDLGEQPAAVYRLYDAHGDLLYVGLTATPATRWREHRKEMLWWPEVADTRLVWYNTRPEAAAAEREAICTEGPRYNKSTWPGMVPSLPPGVPAQPHGARTAYQHRETRGAYRIRWYLWRLTLQDALETQRESTPAKPSPTS